MNTADKSTRSFIAGLDISFMPKKATGSIGLDAIQPDPEQPRKAFDEEKLREMTDSIKANGVLSPIGVLAPENGIHTIVFGERRWRAAKLAGLSEIPAVIVDPTKVNVRAAQLIENIQRSRLTPEEIAVAIDGLAKTGFKTGEIATQLGLSKARISEYRAIVDMPDAIRVHVNEIGSQAAYQLFGLWKKDRAGVEAFLGSTPSDAINRPAIARLADVVNRKGDASAPAAVTPPEPNGSGSTAPVSASPPDGGNANSLSAPQEGDQDAGEGALRERSPATSRKRSDASIEMPQPRVDTSGKMDVVSPNFVVRVGDEFGRLLVDRTGPDSKTALVAFNNGADIRPVPLSEIAIFEIVAG